MFSKNLAIKLINRIKFAKANIVLLNGAFGK